MSLFIAGITNEVLYIATDGRIRQDIPLVGRRFYDCCDKVGSLDDNSTFWMTAVGQIGAAAKIFEHIENKAITCIDTLNNIEAPFFRNIHEAILDKYGLQYKGKDDLTNSLTLLFGGLTKDGQPRICLVDSADNYEKKWLYKNGDFVFSRVDNGKIDLYIKNNLTSIFPINNRGKEIDDIVLALKNIFIYVSTNDIGVSPLMYFIKISSEKVIYKEFHCVKKIFDKVRFTFDKFLYLKVLKLQKP